ncbi:hypothetical protein P5663_07100 [Priestia flexa]|uniref:hypothetical protein n=1 Tax=Priestia flexa TaxID=86664 RepID=UPI00240D4C6F|nr:hypothetical protein [Priestia flexa]WEZ09602.1 hypothetical protein P5663_07100 [Priestia flexa]
MQVYELENGTKPTLNELESGGYLKEGTVCPNGSKITIGTDGRVSASDGNS